MAYLLNFFIKTMFILIPRSPCCRRLPQMKKVNWNKAFTPIFTSQFLLLEIYLAHLIKYSRGHLLRPINLNKWTYLSSCKKFLWELNTIPIFWVKWRIKYRVIYKEEMALSMNDFFTSQQILMRENFLLIL